MTAKMMHTHNHPLIVLMLCITEMFQMKQQQTFLNDQIESSISLREAQIWSSDGTPWWIGIPERWQEYVPMHSGATDAVILSYMLVGSLLKEHVFSSHLMLHLFSALLTKLFWFLVL